MARLLTVASAQLGPVARTDSRSSVVRRLVELLRESSSLGCRVVTFPELALTTFFPRWYMEDAAEIDSFFEREMPGPETKPLFEEASRLGSSCIVAPTGEIVAQSSNFGDELITHRCDLDLGAYLKLGILNFEANRRIEHYQRITAQRGAARPAADREQV